MERIIGQEVEVANQTKQVRKHFPKLTVTNCVIVVLHEVQTKAQGSNKKPGHTPNL